MHILLPCSLYTYWVSTCAILKNSTASYTERNPFKARRTSPLHVEYKLYHYTEKLRCDLGCNTIETDKWDILPSFRNLNLKAVRFCEMFLNTYQPTRCLT